MKIREIGIFLLFKLPVPNKIFRDWSDKLIYFLLRMGRGRWSHALFGPMAMILSATTDTFSD
jgi:hypothetical protein